jgi:hypothetical protein
MRRLLVGILLVATAGLAAVGTGGTAHGATNAVCDEPHGLEVNGNVSGNVSVPANGVCHIHGWTIGGNVTVANNAKLFTRSGTVIHGNVSASSPAQVNIEERTQIDGDFSASGPGTAFGGFICGSTIGGNVSVSGFSVAAPGWVIGEPTTPPPDGYVYNGGGSSDPDLTCESPNSIHGNVTLTGNNIARLKLAANTIGNPAASNAYINNNTVHNESVKVEANTIAGNLGCAGNVWTGGSPAVTNEGLQNIVSGTESGQCAGL